MDEWMNGWAGRQNGSPELCARLWGRGWGGARGRLTMPYPQPLPPGPLWGTALLQRDGGLRRAHLHDPPDPGHLPHPAGGLP